MSIVPRGGRSLVERVMNESKVPVFAHLEGLCHVYVDRAADLETARRVVMNAKMRRVSVCGAAETLLVDRAVAASPGPDRPRPVGCAGCEGRGDETVQGSICACSRPPRPTGRPNISNPSSRPASSMGLRAPSRISTATARTIPTAFSPRIPRERRSAS